MKELTEQMMCLYVGCECSYSWTAVDEKNIRGRVTPTLINFMGFGGTTPSVYDVKLILRPLSSMTEDEFKESGAYDESLEKLGVALLKDQHLMFNREARAKEDRCWFPDTYLFFTSRGFDLFDLIPSGLAIDSTTLK